MSTRLGMRGLACVALVASGFMGWSAAHAQYQPPLIQTGIGLEPPRALGPGCQNCPPGVMPGVPYQPAPTMPRADQETRPGEQRPGEPQAPSEQPSTPNPDTLGQAGGRGTLGDTGGSPNIFGDLIGLQASRVVVSQHSSGSSILQQSGNKAVVAAPLPYRGAFKITENESPLPTTRVYFNYNYFDNVTNALGNLGIPGNADLHRETFGFEYAFMDNNASVGVRLPLYQLVGGRDIADAEVGDLTLVGKYAFINNRETGSVLSGGMVLTLPTSKSVLVPGDSSINDYIFQPFIGYIYNFSRDFYIQGFSSLTVPTDARDVTILFNSLAIGYWAYRDTDQGATLRGIIPVLETHVSDPFNHRGINSASVADPLFFSDTVNLTTGAHFVFNRADVGVAVGVPLTGPKPYDIEANATLNIRF